MKKFIYLIVATIVATLTVKVDALTNSGKLYMQYYQEAKVNVFASDETYHSLDYYGTNIESTADNEIYYCIEPEVPMPLYNAASYNSHTIYEGKSSIVNQSRLTNKTYDKVSLLAYYGYNYNLNGINHTSKKWYGITQVLIWQTIRSDVNYVFKTSRYGDIDKNLYKSEVNELENLVNNHNKIPSFSNTNVVLTKGETVELVDNNNVINTFTAKSNDIANIEIRNNILFIRGLENGETEITFTKKETTNDFRLYKSNTHQNIISRGNVENPSFKLKIKVASGFLTVEKVDKDTNTYNESLNGTLFEIYRSDDDILQGIEIFNQKETVEIPYGNYYLKEVISSSGYSLNENKYHFTIDDNNKEVTIVVPNEKIKGELILEKYKGGLDEEFTFESNATFEIYKDNKLVDKITTDEKGIGKSSLEIGKYFIKQIKGSEGYSYIDSFYVDISEEKEYRFKLKNIKKSILEITKIDYSSNKVLKDAKLAIYDLNNNLIFTGITNEEGILKIKNLDIGKYYIKEIEAPKYYNLSEEKIYFDVKKDGELIKISITNERNSGTLKFLKVDDKTKLGLKDTKIRVTYLDTNEVLFEGLTNESGEIILDNIVAGTYSIKEITPSYGYLLNEEEITFELIENNEIIEIVMENKKIEMPNTYLNLDNLKIILICFIVIAITKMINKEKHEK